MPAIPNAPPEAAVENLPEVPLTLEGASMLHQMLRVRWTAWKALPAAERSQIVQEAAVALAEMERNPGGQSAAFSLLGHKGDLILVHFRPSFDELSQVESRLARFRLWDYLEPATSYLSVVELGLYESSMKTYHSLVERGIQPFSPEWNAAIEDVLARQREAMHPRLYPEMPPHKYLCFYPMDRKRGEDKNWYRLPMAERQRQMHEHGMIGRRYAGEVKQIISGSIGFDDWEWGVDLFADDPLVFKRLIYEMRFDEVSAVYALFGTFYVGIRCPAAELANWLAV
ncbi:MAG TPA: hydrogen peroxide-dependent heme synthase [Bryobacteraceae bacterium]|nr:hydrogen peroxide-dependent heme synthase [Bryobacteraceae bacterium]